MHGSLCSVTKTTVNFKHRFVRYNIDEIFQQNGTDINNPNYIPVSDTPA